MQRARNARWKLHMLQSRTMEKCNEHAIAMRCHSRIMEKMQRARNARNALSLRTRTSQDIMFRSHERLTVRGTPAGSDKQEHIINDCTLCRGSPKNHSGTLAFAYQDIMFRSHERLTVRGTPAGSDKQEHIINDCTLCRGSPKNHSVMRPPTAFTTPAAAAAGGSSPGTTGVQSFLILRTSRRSRSVSWRARCLSLCLRLHAFLSTF